MLPTWKLLPAFLALVGLLLLSTPQHAQAQEVVEKEKKNFSLAVLPTIGYSRTLGFKLGAMGMGFFALDQRDSISPPSTVGFTGMWTSNHSWFTMAYARLFIDQDRYRLIAAGGLSSFNAQFYEDNLIPGGAFIDFNTASNFVYLQFTARTWGQLFLGFQTIFSKRVTAYDVEIPVGENNQRWFNGLGGVALWDTRTNVYNSRGGMFLKLSNFFYRPWLGSEVSYNNLQFEANRYFLFEEHKLLAVRFFTYIAMGDEIPFEGQKAIGRDDIRGYTQGEFRGDQMLDVQAEYRWTFSGRWGLVGFFGLAASFEPGDWSGILPGGGAGIRYMVLPERGINAGIDLALGVRDWGVYFRITEAF